MTTNTVDPIPDGYHSLTPYLAVPDGAKAIEFYRQVFGAEVISRQELPDGRVGQAELRFGDSMLQPSDQMPQLGLRAPNGEWVHSSLVHYVPDVDATFAKAVEAGARPVEQVQTFMTGDRRPVRHGDRSVRAPVGDPDQGRGRVPRRSRPAGEGVAGVTAGGTAVGRFPAERGSSPSEEAARRNRPLRQFRRTAD
jgi:uncharacterized glyoxalase superfamily protein PhnB